MIALRVGRERTPMKDGKSNRHVAAAGKSRPIRGPLLGAAAETARF